MSEFTAEWVVSMVSMIKSGMMDKATMGDITIYRCGSIIRIDIKER